MKVWLNNSKTDCCTKGENKYYYYYYYLISGILIMSLRYYIQGKKLHHSKYGHIARILLHAHKNDNLSLTDRHVIVKRFAFRGNYSQLRHEGWYVPRRGIWRVKCFWQLRSTAFFAHPIWDDKPAIDTKQKNVMTVRVSYLIHLNNKYLYNGEWRRHFNFTYGWDLLS